MSSAGEMPPLQKLKMLVSRRLFGHPVKWTSNLEFTLRGYEFTVPGNLGNLIANNVEVVKQNPDRFYLRKHREILQCYFRLFEHINPRNVLDVGIADGGSAPFLQLLLRPEKLLALELATDRVKILDEFIEAENLGKSLKTVYGINQGDADRVHECCVEHFGSGRTIDLVIDDASHRLEPTRNCFDTVFPMIRPGGSYIVEDYAAVPIMLKQWLGGAGTNENSNKLVRLGLDMFMGEDQRPLHAMAVEAMLASITAPNIVDSIEVNEHWLRIVRGGKDIEDPGNFSLRDLAIDHFGLAQTEPAAELSRYLDQ